MTDEQAKRLQEIRERRNSLQLRQGDSPCQTVHNARERTFQQYILADIDFLLALVDGQGAAHSTTNLLRRLKDFLFENCDHSARDRNYDWCPSCVMAFMEIVSKPSDTHIATSRRSACVEKVKELRDEWQRKHEQLNSDADLIEKLSLEGDVRVADQIINVLQSITIQEQEKQL